MVRFFRLRVLEIDGNSADETARTGIRVRIVPRLYVVARVGGEGREVLHREEYADAVGANGIGPTLRQRVADLQILDAQVFAILQVGIGAISVGIGAAYARSRVDVARAVDAPITGPCRTWSSIAGS